ncbi:hypothetical protein [Biostraticola tofi]|uniref:Uncharacterized protein n=1 Tax=Biostraticola tofi TaxID=466109 RepID=A0A4R3YPL3_9GAMM|nr:hypothetical protein [Biostraticola tofi]TCV94320.1 hypothetical protein EDC52_10760 [Biostraticola tofi]
MEADFFLIEHDGKTSIHKAEFEIGKISLVQKITLQGIAHGAKLNQVMLPKDYESFVHTSANGRRYLVAVAGPQLSSAEIDDLISNAAAKPRPLS